MFVAIGPCFNRRLPPFTMVSLSNLIQNLVKHKMNLATYCNSESKNLQNSTLNLLVFPIYQLIAHSPCNHIMWNMWWVFNQRMILWKICTFEFSKCLALIDDIWVVWNCNTFIMVLQHTFSRVYTFTNIVLYNTLQFYKM
jgi:hypothetical protein